MKTSILKFTASLLIIAGSFFSCKEETAPLIERTYLEGTKWKLAGIVNTETGVLKELEPVDCEHCYTLTFDTDYTATSRSIWMTRKIDLLNLDPYVPLSAILFCERYYVDGSDYCDSDVFRTAVIRTESYTAMPEELKLHFNLGYYYLSFKPFTVVE
ncbi:MAG: hypothetical protein FWH23_05840 [Bacteroidales bacterium]|nr:hypothetical protein [Bacteroidales bacterium]